MKIGFIAQMIDDFYKQPFPILDLDDNFYLREQCLSDTAAFFEYYTDPKVAQYILASNPKNHAEASTEIQYCRDLFYQRHGIYWTIARKDNDRMIGAIGLYINNFHHRAEICYDLSRAYWRQGIMTRVIHRVLMYAFLHIGVNRMEALTMKENIASMGVLEKNGFAHEGQLRNYRYFQGRSHDVEMFGLTPEMYFRLMSTEKKQTQMAEMI